MELFIGVNFLGHDSAIFVIDPQKQDVFAISSERITRFKHDTIFPVSALDKYISNSNLDVNQVSKVVCGNARLEHKSLKIYGNQYDRDLFYRELFKEPYLKGYKTAFSRFKSLSDFSKNKFLFLKSKLRPYQNLVNSTETKYQSELLDTVLRKAFPKAEIVIEYFDHEECHAVSSYFTSNFENDALLITMDAQGDHNRFSSVYTVKSNQMSLFASSISPNKFFTFSGKYNQIEFESSVGGMYTYFTYMLGFTPNADEGKVEALAAFGNYQNEVYDKLWKCFKVLENNEIQIFQEDAELLFSMDEFNRFMSSYKKEDICAAIQKFLEEFMLIYIKQLMAATGIKTLCFSGGVFANVILNLRVYEELTQELYIVPAMTDEGTAEGAAYLTFLSQNNSISDLKWLKQKYMPYFGTSYTREQISEELKKHADINYKDEYDQWPELTAQLVAEGKVGAIFHGRMEWGPRALGNRSIVADCRSEEITKKINGSIKNRPLFQPFCPSILEEERERLFEKSYPNKHMTCAFRMRQEHRNNIPASVHVDGTGRAQFVEEKDNPMYFRYLKELKKLTGYGVSINTSFNKHGRTIVETPKDAIQDFLDTNMDFVMIEGYLITRK